MHDEPTTDLAQLGHVELPTHQPEQSSTTSCSPSEMIGERRQKVFEDNARRVYPRLDAALRAAEN